MTAIAYKDGFLAADRMVTWGGVQGRVQKIHKQMVEGHGNCVIALSGYMYGVQKILELLETTSKGTGQDHGGMEAQSRYGILIAKLGNRLQVHAIYGDGRVGPAEHHENNFVAEGSAFQFLMGAMAMGADAAKAVELATEYCECCGYGVDVVDCWDWLRYR